MSTKIKDHYEVLGVLQDADATSIKKAHRKLALRCHPDKNIGDENAAETFRLIQQAYECLSDPADRKWYDEHREAILRGWTANGTSLDVDILFDVVPFMYAGCYSGYDDENGFFGVYQTVFMKIHEAEKEGWVSEGNIDDMPFAEIPIEFGFKNSDWDQVGAFYTAWESFSSCLAFAWADKYDIKDAGHRRIRRAMEDENKKVRRVAKRKYNEDVAALVHFVKRRDPRVKAHRVRLEQELVAKMEATKEEARRKKEMTQQARKEWRQQAEEQMVLTEEEDRAAGRIRLADLEDNYDYGFGKRGKKKKKKKKQHKNDIEENKEEEEDSQHDAKELTESNQMDKNEYPQDHTPEEIETYSHNEFLDQEFSPEDEDEPEDEPDFWRCELCRKDFKSLGQMENHLKSKKHKEKLKWQKSKN
eukprot:CAMPEP_0194166784 /NCGR_PEP_ID=MMETSP0154-20130528/2297_1 /TAXON_ID=1049557 /ORGANISM="Thalassiothrix antarctica, Strain L6-D1" /LENGTH=416 /DNA_ID=CAMNT_0038877553 /DNA_START=12 /DNA_END=1262 /DNA_ORIENTATION=+